MRVNIESSALAEGRFNKLAQEFFEGSRAEAIGTLVLIWFDSQEREFVSGPKSEIISFFPYFDDSQNERLFSALVKHGYIKRHDDDLFEIAGNERHVEKKKSISEARRNSAIKGNQVRWGDRKTSQAVANDHKVSQADAVNTMQFNSVQCNSIQTTKKAASPFDFEIVYAEFPKKVGKKKGLEICRKVIKTQIDYDSLITAVRRYAAHIKRENPGEQYIKHFSTFMGSWTDWLDPNAGKVKFAQSPNNTPLQSGPANYAPIFSMNKEKLDELKKTIKSGLKTLSDDGPKGAA